MNNLKDAIEAAAERIGPHVLETPVVEAPSLSSELGCEVLLKLENIQKTGSFKIRGALNKVLQLTEAEKAAGIVTASSGNHGAAVSKAAQIAGGKVDIYVPEGASPAKIANMERLGGTVHVFGSDSGKSELEAQRVAKETGGTYVSPYNDPQVIAGQGTIGLELIRQVPDMDAVIIAVGGGGLASGIAGYLKAVNPKIETIGAAPAASAAMNSPWCCRKSIRRKKLQKWRRGFYKICPNPLCCTATMYSSVPASESPCIPKTGALRKRC